jgi:hypothetical protein
LLFQFAYELHPSPFEWIIVHGFPLQSDMALSSPISILEQYVRKTGGDLVKIAHTEIMM